MKCATGDSKGKQTVKLRCRECYELIHTTERNARAQLGASVSWRAWEAKFNNCQQLSSIVRPRKRDHWNRCGKSRGGGMRKNMTLVRRDPFSRTSKTRSRSRSQIE